MFTQYYTSLIVAALIYSDIESFIKKVEGCKNNPKKSFNKK